MRAERIKHAPRAFLRSVIIMMHCLRLCRKILFPVHELRE